MRVPTFARPIGGLVALAVCGCAADSTVVADLMVVPSYYDTLECSELTAQFRAASQRVNELTALREKAGKDPGGMVANALAYNTEYAKAEASKKYSEAAANRKGCDLASSPPISAKPKPDGPTGPRLPAEHPPRALGGISQ
jgi:hypothetical protein